jgi:uncharacterized protein
MQAYTWADHRLFPTQEGALLFGVDHASLFALDSRARDTLGRWRSADPLALEDAPEEARGVLEELRDARVLVPLMPHRRARPAPAPELDPAGVPLETLVLEVAQTCNLRCSYCYAHGGTYGGAPRLLDPETARRAARTLLDRSGDRPAVTLVLFGGEPLLNFPAVRAAVEEAEAAAAAAGKELTLSLTTNGTLFTPEVLTFLRDHRVLVSVSIDGPPELHDRNRPYAGGGGTYADVTEGLAALARWGIPAAARVTLAPSQWSRIPEVFDHLLGLGVREVGIAPASPVTPELLPTAEQEEALLGGFQALAERFEAEARQGRCLPFANLLDLLGRLHTGRAKGAPCGAGYGYLALDADGRYFLCHRLAGEEAFAAGNLETGPDLEKLRSALRAAAAPRRELCAHCWARRLCAGGCHYENHLRENLLGRAPGDSCRFIRPWLELGLRLYARLRAEPENPVMQRIARRQEC